MITITKNSDNIASYVMEYVADKDADKDDIPVKSLGAGSTVFVIETGTAYMLNSEKEWVEI